MEIPTYEEMLIANEKSKEIEHRIDIAFFNKEYKELEEILKREETQILAGKNQRIYLIYLISEIVAEEINQNVGRNLLEGRKVDEAIRVYRILSLYLRRIEFDFPTEQKNEIVIYILQEKISITAVLGVIRTNTSIIQKDKVVNGLRAVLNACTNN